MHKISKIAAMPTTVAEKQFFDSTIVLSQCCWSADIFVTANAHLAKTAAGGWPSESSPLPLRGTQISRYLIFQKRAKNKKMLQVLKPSGTYKQRLSRNGGGAVFGESRQGSIAAWSSCSVTVEDWK